MDRLTRCIRRLRITVIAKHQKIIMPKPYVRSALRPARSMMATWGNGKRNRVSIKWRFYYMAREYAVIDWTSAPLLKMITRCESFWLLFRRKVGILPRFLTDQNVWGCAYVPCTPHTIADAFQHRRIGTLQCCSGFMQCIAFLKRSDTDCSLHFDFAERKNGPEIKKVRSIGAFLSNRILGNNEMVAVNALTRSSRHSPTMSTRRTIFLGCCCFSVSFVYVFVLFEGGMI